MMEYSEEAIYELQSILKSKVGEYVPVIKKAMDLEDFLYRESLYKNGLDRTGNVWESNDSIKTYIESIENIKKAIKAKEDLSKIFLVADIRQFYLQLTSLRPPPNKKKVPFNIYNYLILSGGRNLGSNCEKRKSENNQNFTSRHQETIERREQ
jgi:hypothetical protein